MSVSSGVLLDVHPKSDVSQNETSDLKSDIKVRHESPISKEEMSALGKVKKINGKGSLQSVGLWSDWLQG